MTQPAYPYAPYSTQPGNPVTNLYSVGNYPTQYSSGTTPQPQYQYQYQPSPEPAPYQEPEKVPSAPLPSNDEAHQWFINPFILQEWLTIESLKMQRFFFTTVTFLLTCFICRLRYFFIWYSCNECKVSVNYIAFFKYEIWLKY